MTHNSQKHGKHTMPPCLKRAVARLMREQGFVKVIPGKTTGHPHRMGKGALKFVEVTAAGEKWRGYLDHGSIELWLIRKDIA